MRSYLVLVLGGMMMGSPAGIGAPSYGAGRAPVPVSGALDSTPPLPTPERLIARHNAFIGSRAALAAYRSLHVSAAVVSTSYDSHWSRDVYWMGSQYYLQQDRMPRVGGWRTGIDGRYVWSTQDHPDGELLDSLGATLVREQAAAVWPWIDPAQFQRADSVQATTLEEHPVYQLRVVRQDNRVDTLYFDAANGYRVAETAQTFFVERKWPMLIQKVVGTRLDRVEGTVIRERIFYREYQAYGRVRFPRVTEEHVTASNFITTTIQRIDFNAADSMVFTMPYELDMKLHR